MEAEAKTYCNMEGKTRSQKSGGGESTFNIYVRPVTALCAPVRQGKEVGVPAAANGRGATQRGAGVDHLAKVQQKNVQTETHIFSTPSPITTLKGTVRMSLNYELSLSGACCLRQNVINTSDDMFFTPWAIVTLLVTLANLVL